MIPPDRASESEEARRHLERGRQPIPLQPRSKKPVHKRWQSLRLTMEELPKHFDGRSRNVGLLLGEPSGGLVDVDLDAPEAMAVADVFLPVTGMVHGRASKPRSHRWYQSEGISKTERFKDVDGTVLVELRSTGGQTVVPPSVHPSGEIITWDTYVDPSGVDGLVLREQVGKVAACALVARHWPKQARHDAALSLAGYLYRLGWSLETAVEFLSAAAGAAHDEEIEDRGRAVRDTFETLRAGKHATGKHTLKDLLGKKTVTKLDKFLRIANQKAKRENLDIDESKAENADASSTIDAILAQLRVPARIKRREAAEFVIEDLVKCGDLIQASGNRQFWFDKNRSMLLNVDSFLFRTFLIQSYRINPAEPEFRHIFEAIKSAIRTQGKRAEVYRFSFFDRAQNILYISAGNGRVVRIDGKEISWIGNGADGVLFEEIEELQIIPTESTSIELNGDPLRECILSRMNFCRGTGVILGPNQQRLILRIWVLALFFPELLPAKCLLLLYGEKGSGKSTSLRVILKLLLGPKADVTPLGKEDGFNAAVSQEYLLGLDNVDSRCSWIEDRLATVATGQSIKLRRLYTTNEMVSFPTRCFLALTARTPRFRRDDVVDRLLILRVDRLEKFSPESDWYQEVEKHRAVLWAQILRDLNRVVALLKDKGTSGTCKLRMADWAFLAGTIGDALGCGDEVRSSLEAAEVDKASFLLETDNLYDLLQAVATEHPNREWKAGELFAQLTSRTERNRSEFSIKSPRSLGRILHRLEPALRLMIRFEIRTLQHDGQSLYLLGPLPEPDDKTSTQAPSEQGNYFHDPDF